MIDTDTGPQSAEPGRNDEADRRILLLGANGQLGWELRRALMPLGAVVAAGRGDIDLARPDTIAAALERLRPDVVVNAAAYTDVDGAELDRETAFRVNAEGPAALASSAARCGAILVHYSTDYVFKGNAAVPYAEDAPAAPCNVYGESKLAGEVSVAAGCARYLILRTSWLYGMRGHNFLRTVLRLAGERDELSIVDDQHGCPTWTRAVAAGTAAVLVNFLAPDTTPPPFGLYHMAARGVASWYDFACAILELNRERGSLAALRPVPTAGLARAAARPHYSVLDCTRLAHAFGVQLPHWREQLALALDAPGRGIDRSSRNL